MIELRDQVRMDNILMFKNDKPEDPTYIKVHDISLFNCGYGEIEFPSTGEVRWDKLCGVPLTEELLVKCGMVQIPTKPDDEWTNGHCMIKHDAPDPKYWAYYRWDKLILADVIFLHQLQNLFQDLNGEKIKPRL